MRERDHHEDHDRDPGEEVDAVDLMIMALKRIGLDDTEIVHPPK